MEDKQPGVTVKQMNFIKTLAEREKGRALPDFEKMSMAEAKFLIADWLGDAPQDKPKQVSSGQIKMGEGPVENNTVILGLIADTLKQILSELKEKK